MRFRVFILLFSVMFLTPSFVVAKTPNDPYFAQWSFEDTGVYNAWDYTTGSKDVVVAIIDNGFDTFHPDLRDNLWINKDEIPNNLIDDDHNGFVDDINGWNFLDNNNDPRPIVENLTDSQKSEGVFNHATIVAGIVGAKGNNNFDGTGINWDVSLMNLKVIGNDGMGDFTPLIKAIRYAVDNGANVINISMVGEGHEQELIGVINYAYEHGVVVVAAAGNGMADLNANNMYPVCADGGPNKEKLLGVSAIDNTHHLAIFSNIGSDCVDITAPGVNIRSALRFSPTNGLLNSYSLNKSWSGTSFSAPFVSGAAALLKSINPGLSVDQIFDILFSTTHHTPSSDEVSYANSFGKGLLQIDKAVESVFKNNNNSLTKPSVSPQVVNTDNISRFFQNTTAVFVSSKLGQGELFENNKSTRVEGEGFLGVEDTYSFFDQSGQLKNATLSTGTNGKKIVNFYNNKLDFLSKVNIDLKGDFDLALGDLYGNGETEIFLAPRSQGTNYFYVYSNKGVLLKTYSKKNKHSGSSIDFHNGQVVLAYNDDYKTNVEILDKDFNLLNSFSSNNILSGQIMAFDLDGDIETEYILSAKAGTTAWVRVFGNSGSEIYSFRVYPNQFKTGFHFALVDYGKNGNFNFIFTPNDNSTPMRVTTVSGQFVTEKFPFDGVTYGQVFSLLTKN